MTWIKLQSFDSFRQVKIMWDLQASEFHWFFTQGLQAVEQGLYLPGISALLNGIEASIRITLHQLKGLRLPPDGDLGATLSNPLIRKAHEADLPVHLLAFPNETDFQHRLESNTPHVEIVRVRHNIGHGNILEYIDRSMNIELFTPDCMRELATTLSDMTYDWAKRLAEYRSARIAT